MDGDDPPGRARGGPALHDRGGGTYAIYRVDRPHSYFLKGKGRIVAVGPNRVELADVEPEGGAVVLSLHWLDTWQTDPPADAPARADAARPGRLRPDRGAGAGPAAGPVNGYGWRLSRRIQQNGRIARRRAEAVG